MQTTLSDDLNAALSHTLFNEAVDLEIRIAKAIEGTDDDVRRERLISLSIRAQDRYVRRYSAWWDFYTLNK